MRNKVLLIVEDDADVRLGYQILLKTHHYDTVFAADALAAHREGLKHKPDLMLLDLGLPGGDGFLLLERFRANMNLAQIPVIVVSARNRNGNEERSLDLGARAFVHKPFSNHELLALIGETLGDTPAREREAVSAPHLLTGRQRLKH
jgi:DNA-binding response OmpR family regulator